jgi:D-arabinose 1-dehydrogenase-like Zn-dependent alcohol dehydrogenase
MSSMRVVQVPRPHGPFALVERDIPEPGAGSVRIKVEAWGIWHSDSFIKEGRWPGNQYPRVPGHEVAGIIDAVGTGVAGGAPGQRVGVGWHGGHCGYCDSCRRGDFFGCQIAAQVTGITYDGGYADYMIAPVQALALIPEELSAVLARTLGAQHYTNSQAQDAVAELLKLGGAAVILATVTNGKAMSAVMGGLGADGKFIVLGAADEPLEVSAFLLIAGRRSVMGWYSGTAIDSQDTRSLRRSDVSRSAAIG